MQPINVFVKKADRAFDLSPESLPAHVVEYIWRYGATQILNDSVASAKTQDEALALVTKRFENLVAGTLRASSGRSADPVAREAQAIAVAAVAKALVKKGLAKNPSEAAKHADFKSLVAEYAKRETTLEKARAVVALRGNDEEDIDIG